MIISREWAERNNLKVSGNPARKEPCFACGRKLGKNPHGAVTSDAAQMVFVGSECYKLIGPEGYQPPLGGPRLYRAKCDPSGWIIEVVGL